MSNCGIILNDHCLYFRREENAFESSYQIRMFAFESSYQIDAGFIAFAIFKHFSSPHIHFPVNFIHQINVKVSVQFVFTSLSFVYIKSIDAFQIAVLISCHIYLIFLVFCFILSFSFFFNLDPRFQYNKHAMNISNTSTGQGLLLMLTRGCVSSCI